MARRKSPNKRRRPPPDRPLNVLLPGKVADEFDELAGREMRQKRLLASIALWDLSRRSSHEIMDLMGEYVVWLSKR